MAKSNDDAGDLRGLHGSPLAAAALHGPTHVLTDVNEAFCRLVSEDRAALLGRPFSEVVPSGDEERECIALLDRVFKTGEPESLADELQGPSGQAEPAYWSYSAWVAPDASRGADQPPVGVVVQVTDTTEAHVFRQMAALMNEELIVSSVRLHEQTETMAQADRAKDEFLAMLGHELRNPLHAISNAAKLVELQTVGQETLRQPVRIMVRQVRHTARLVEDLLDVTRISHGKLELRNERVDLSAAARRAADVAQSAMDLAGCTFTVRTPEEATWVEGDPTRLEQILGNLLNNAAKYTGPGGSVTLTLRSEGGEAVIEVQDTGTGIAPDMLPHVFDLFFQEGRSLNRSLGGLGIGLSLVKTLAELHGGRVEAESEGEGKGSRFTVRLPALPDATPAETITTAEPERTIRRRVLIVDDNVDAADTLSDILEMWGHTVRRAHDGLAAIEAVRRDPPDIVLLDLALPGMDGIEVARNLRATAGLGSLKLVALTGYGSQPDRRRTQSAGFDVHLVKPVDLDHLQQVLSDVMS